jgi:hypothetical protein
VHDTARMVHPDARVVYVDNDPVVVSHASALLATHSGIYAADADITKPDMVFGHPAVLGAIDWNQPVGIVLAACLHFHDSVRAGQLLGAYARAASAGSWLAVSVFGGRDKALEARSRTTYTAASFWVHGEADLTGWLDGLDVVPPGICEARRWLSGIGGVPAQGGWVLCAVAVKPR